jgi:cytochrome c-type biogenesis protein CcmH/NrfG
MRQAYYQLGRAYQALGQAKDAEAAFAKAQELARESRDLPQTPLDPGAVAR